MPVDEIKAGMQLLKEQIIKLLNSSGKAKKNFSVYIEIPYPGNDVQVTILCNLEDRLDSEIVDYLQEVLKSFDIEVHRQGVNLLFSSKILLTLNTSLSMMGY